MSPCLGPVQHRCCHGRRYRSRVENGQHAPAQTLSGTTTASDDPGHMQTLSADATASTQPEVATQTYPGIVAYPPASGPTNSTTMQSYFSPNSFRGLLKLHPAVVVARTARENEQSRRSRIAVTRAGAVKVTPHHTQTDEKNPIGEISPATAPGDQQVPRTPNRAEFCTLAPAQDFVQSEYGRTKTDEESAPLSAGPLEVEAGGGKPSAILVQHGTFASGDMSNVPKHESMDARRAAYPDAVLADPEPADRPLSSPVNTRNRDDRTLALHMDFSILRPTAEDMDDEKKPSWMPKLGRSRKPCCCESKII
ncbi:hypothetical protein MMC07_000294 [Pseudocyphellaria aurata]|nr:hypothetical protein [Pseudocyphellaria aurata]